jgi:hypothetical protein
VHKVVTCKPPPPYLQPMRLRASLFAGHGEGALPLSWAAGQRNSATVLWQWVAIWSLFLLHVLFCFIAGIRACGALSLRGSKGFPPLAKIVPGHPIPPRARYSVVRGSVSTGWAMGSGTCPHPDRPIATNRGNTSSFLSGRQDHGVCTCLIPCPGRNQDWVPQQWWLAQLQADQPRETNQMVDTGAL